MRLGRVDVKKGFFGIEECGRWVMMLSCIYCVDLTFVRFHDMHPYCTVRFIDQIGVGWPLVAGSLGH